MQIGLALVTWKAHLVSEEGVFLYISKSWQSRYFPFFVFLKVLAPGF